MCIIDVQQHPWPPPSKMPVATPGHDKSISKSDQVSPKEPNVYLKKIQPTCPLFYVTVSYPQ